MKTSAEGIALIKKFEGCELTAYQCSASVWTIGYGHTSGVEEGDTCTQDEAESFLQDDLEEF
jgi:lysozyme